MVESVTCLSARLSARSYNLVGSGAAITTVKISLGRVGVLDYPGGLFILPINLPCILFEAYISRYIEFIAR